MGAGPEQRQGRLLGEPEAGTAAPAAGQGTQRLWPRGPSRPARPHRCGAHLRPSAAWPCPGRAPRGRGRCVGSGAWGCAGVGGGCGVTRGRAEASFLIRGLAGPVGGAGLHSEGRKASSALSSRLRSRPETLGAALALALASVCSPRAAPAQRGPSEPAADLAAARDAVGPFYRGEDQGAAPPQAGPRSAGSTRGGGGRGGGPWSPWRERLLDCVVSGFWPPNPRGFPGPGRWGPLLWTLPALLRSPGTSGRSLASEVPAYTRRAAVARRAVGTTGARSPALPAQGHGLGGEASEGPGLVHGRVTNTCPPAGRGVLP